MKKKFLATIIATSAILSINSIVYAGGSCPPGKACSENFMLDIAQDSTQKDILEQMVVHEERKVELSTITFTELSERTAYLALSATMKRADAWIKKQDPEVVLNLSQSTTCDKSGRCSAFVTILYQKIVTK